MHSGARAFALIAAVACATPAKAGLNSGGTVSVSWSPDSFVFQADCAPVNTVYVTCKRSGGLTFAGGEVLLSWVFGLPAPARHDPTGVDGCISYLQSTFPQSTTCNALNDGSTTVLTEETLSESFGGYVHLAWLNSETTTGCDSGLVAQVQIESDTCAPCGALVWLESATAFDGTSSDFLAVNYASLFLGEGPSFPVVPTTWGAIKDLMRR